MTDFSWEPKGERFAIVSSSDPNLGNPGQGVTIKTDVSFYILDRAKNDFKLLSAYHLTYHISTPLTDGTDRDACWSHDQHYPVVTARPPCSACDGWFHGQVRA